MATVASCRLSALIASFQLAHAVAAHSALVLDPDFELVALEESSVFIPTA
jgi:hypothetical protein